MIMDDEKKKPPSCGAPPLLGVPPAAHHSGAERDSVISIAFSIGGSSGASTSTSAFPSVPVSTRMLHHVSRASSVATTGTTSSSLAHHPHHHQHHHHHHTTLFDRLLIKLDIVELVVKSTVHIAEDLDNSALSLEMSSVVERVVHVRELVGRHYHDEHLAGTRIAETLKGLLDTVTTLNADMCHAARDLLALADQGQHQNQHQQQQQQHQLAMGADHDEQLAMADRDVLYEAVRALREAHVMVTTASSTSPTASVAEMAEEADA